MYFFVVCIFWCLQITGQTYIFPFDLRPRRQTDVSYGSPAYKYCECGRKNTLIRGKSRILGGHEVTENEFPWMAIIFGNRTRLVCGGTIINDQYVLTAAHCLILGFRREELKVTVGEHDLCTPDSRTVIFSVEKLIPHPKYDSRTKFADIMLIRLNMRITFNAFVRPICLPKSGSSRVNIVQFHEHPVSVLGWGYGDILGDVCILRSVELILYSQSSCPAKAATLLCAGYKLAERGACQGDSGGPLQVINHEGKFEIIGIVSSGIGCGDVTYPGFYTNVAYMIPWIKHITTKDSMYCWR